jgi:hypothetical protein
VCKVATILAVPAFVVLTLRPKNRTKAPATGRPRDVTRNL